MLTGTRTQDSFEFLVYVLQFRLRKKQFWPNVFSYILLSI